MNPYRYVIADVFTDTPLEGNGLAVFTQATGIDEGTMARLAREINLSETVFTLAPEQGGDARIRIFTPARAIFAYRLVATYARGYALAEITGFAIDVRAEEPFPVIRSLSRRIASEPSEANFRAGLETILGGLRAEREAP